MITSFNCQNKSLFLNAEDNISMCESLLDNFHVSNIYLTYNDLSFVQDCSNSNGKCSILLQVNEDAASYMKTIGGANSSGYRIIIEYAENKDGSKCTADKCTYYYTTLSLGDV
jgi:hypothetical protein